MDVGSADVAGENICHPCRLDARIPAADGLEQWVSFLFILLVRTVTPFFGNDVIQRNIPALAV